jgi:hypothetical protein
MDRHGQAYMRSFQAYCAEKAYEVTKVSVFIYHIQREIGQVNMCTCMCIFKPVVIFSVIKTCNKVEWWRLFCYVCFRYVYGRSVSNCCRADGVTKIDRRVMWRDIGKGIENPLGN